MSDEKALVKRETTYPVLAPEEDFGALLEANVGHGNLSPFDLERLKIPAGGAVQWTSEGLSGQETFPVIRGIVAAFADVRSYWKDAYSGDTPPECTSEDGFHGKGDPGGMCARCPFAEFGSAQNGEGQACKQVRRLFVVREGARLPTLLCLPPTSIKPCRQFFLKITNAGLPFWGLIVEIGLEQAQSKSNIKYSRATFRAAKDGKGQLATLTPDEAARMKAYGQAVRDAVSRSALAADEFVIGEDE